MFVPVCDRPSVAKPTGPRERTVMETRSAAIHRKMPASPRQLPITGSAHKAGVIGESRVGAVLAARNMPAECRRAATLDRRHHLELVEAHMAGIGLTPRRSEVADIRDFESGTDHGCRLMPADRTFCWSAV